ncbi:hypothetical protein [Flavobacterium hydrocarbonoxydans]|uniref:hypothetical protein n=1 Tax=Flavobacterium hydrocarbonoxydans TaxID=2683249 RepID=UPI001E4E47E3|nr:hypothetical protein [Flavobacterium hydrocarbonoxydans]
MTTQANKVIIREKIRIENGVRVVSEYKTKNKTPIKGMKIPIKATNKNFKE